MSIDQLIELRPKTHRSLRLMSIVFAMAACLMLLIHSPVNAQQRAGSDGRALDANNRVGSDGTNTVQGQVDYRARNDVITGNVTGGRAFRDSVGYGSQFEFRDTLGSDSLFRFRAQSLPSSVYQLNATSRNSALQAGPTRVYRSFGQMPINPSRQYGSAEAPIAGIGGRVVPQEASSVLARNFFDIDSQISNRVGMTTDEQGQVYSVEASPLMGVRQRAMSPAPAGVPKPARQETETQQSDQPDNTLDSRSMWQGYRLNADLRRQTDYRQTATDSIMSQSTDAVSPGLILGRQVQGRIKATTLGQPGQTLDDQVARLERAIFDRVGTRIVEPGQDVYLDVLKALRQSQDPNQQQQRRRIIDQLGKRPESDQPFKTVSREALDAPSAEKIRKAELDRINAIRKAYGLSPKGVPGAASETDGAGETATTGQSGDGVPTLEELEKSREPLTALLNQLRQDLPPLETMAGQRSTRVNNMLREAEQAMAKGEFFAAESRYRQVLVDAEDHPLGRAGLVNAQLGAGLIRSAASNLRKLFQTHPEVIGLRYGAALLPPEKRLKWLQKELQKKINDESFDAEPSLLLAYLGHQVQSRQLVRYGLATAEARSPRDPLLAILRSIWLKPENGDDSDKLTAPEDATQDATESGTDDQPNQIK